MDRILLNSTLNDTPSNFYTTLDKISDSIGQYFIMIISIIGFVINMMMLILLHNLKHKEKSYDHLWFKSFCDFMVCLFGIGYLNSL